MSSRSPYRNRRNRFTDEDNTLERSARLDRSQKKYDNFRSKVNEIMNDVSETRSINHKSEIADISRTIDRHINPQNDQDVIYITKLEKENNDIRQKIQAEKNRKEKMLKKAAELQNTIRDNKNKIDLELENKALKTRLMKQTDDYNGLHEELARLKRDRDQLKQQTDDILNRRYKNAHN